jgi:hypothetical protein
MEATVALNSLLERLPDMQLDSAADSSIVGLAFRSPNTLPVTFGR